MLRIRKERPRLSELSNKAATTRPPDATSVWAKVADLAAFESRYMGDPARVNEVQRSIREQIMCRTGVDAGCENEVNEPCLVPLGIWDEDGDDNSADKDAQLPAKRA